MLGSLLYSYIIEFSGQQLLSVEAKFTLGSPYSKLPTPVVPRSPEHFLLANTMIQYDNQSKVGGIANDSPARADGVGPLSFGTQRDG